MLQAGKVGFEELEKHALEVGELPPVSGKQCAYIAPPHLVPHLKYDMHVQGSS